MEKEITKRSLIYIVVGGVYQYEGRKVKIIRATLSSFEIEDVITRRRSWPHRDSLEDCYLQRREESISDHSHLLNHLKYY